MEQQEKAGLQAREGALPSGGFAQQAARLLESAHANERAVRDLEEAVGLLAEGVGELAACEGLAQSLGDLASQAQLVRASAEHVRACCEAAGDFSRVAQASEDALAAIDKTCDEVEALAGSAEALAQGLTVLDERYAQALAALERMDADALLVRLDGLERRVDAVVARLEERQDAYDSALDARLSRLETLAERLDAPSVANQLAAILACNQRILEHVDPQRR